MLSPAKSNTNTLVSISCKKPKQKLNLMTSGGLKFFYEITNIQNLLSNSSLLFNEKSLV